MQGDGAYKVEEAVTVEVLEDEVSKKTPKQERKELDATLQNAREEMSKCVLDSSWTFTLPAVLLSVPLSIKLKSYAPFVFAGVVASGADYYRGMCQCDDLNENLKKIKLAIAFHEQAHPTGPPSFH